jgi:hypothetical protein
MLAQLNLYAIIALILAIIAVGGGWYITNRISQAELATLRQTNAVLTSAVETNEGTIQQMIVDAQVLAASNQKLTTRIVAAEMEFVDEWAAINALDLESDQALADTSELEKTLNETFQQSVDRLRTAADQ